MLSPLKKDGTVLVTAKQLAEKGVSTADMGTVSPEFFATYPSNY